MRFKDVFSIIGPAMIGPSSSHTAGAARIGRVARQLLGEAPRRAEIVFYGSFADTYRGHGTDLAVVGGLMDWATDDPRIADSLRLAGEAGLDVTIRTGRLAAVHPNTVRIDLAGERRASRVQAASIGGGNIEVHAVDGFDVKFTAMYPTLLVYHRDRPGMIAELAALLSGEGINIGYMDVDRKRRNGDALTVVEADAPLGADLAARIAALKDVTDVRTVDLAAESGGKAAGGKAAGGKAAGGKAAGGKAASGGAEAGGAAAGGGRGGSAQ